MPEGLSPGEADKDVSAPAPSGRRSEARGADRVLTILEALLLAVVPLLAAWSGFASAKWSTHSSFDMARAGTVRTEANRAFYEAADLKNFDGLAFNAWLTAYVSGNTDAMRVAELRFRPEFLVAFKAWMATQPFTSPNAPKEPTYMTEYAQPDLVQAHHLDASADRYYSLGLEAGNNANGYVRITVYLASVLFLMGISGHFPVRAARKGLIALGAIVLVVSGVLLILAPRPPV